MAVLYGRAGRFAAESGGFRPGQWNVGEASVADMPGGGRLVPWVAQRFDCDPTGAPGGSRSRGQRWH